MIRPARPQDAAALARLWNPWITDTAITFNPVPKTGAEIAATAGGDDGGGRADPARDVGRDRGYRLQGVKIGPDGR